ncbi:uncharacterized protein VTP21DRAFT_1236 [Calcarisporiella thermophila]|uniref:uncharacterized protein n=1 Tax=Calcarisporiella thermophila TaxID=911321 RepID=UPI0037426620
MVLEATMIVLDNSEWMRNGDYTPTRIEAQADAVNLIFGAKTQSNPENTVGLMTMAGKSPEVLVTLTSDIGKILSALHEVRIAGHANFLTGIQVAQLALKHRQNKNQRQRVIAFVGSPVDADEKTLVRLAKKMKKNNVAIDIINFGEETLNTAKLEAFINTVNSGDNSHLVNIPPGPHILSDMLITSPIIAGEDGAPPGFSSGGAGQFEFGVDPNLDPELALALRISMEEERARQEAAAKAASEEGKPKTEQVGQSTSENAPAASGGVEQSEDDMLAQALAMSEPGHDGEDVEMDEEEQMQRAIAMSMGGEGDMSSVIGSLPGVDTSDPRVRSAMQKDAEKKDQEKDKQ